MSERPPEYVSAETQAEFGDTHFFKREFFPPTEFHDAAPALIAPNPIHATATEEPVFDLKNDRQRLAMERLHRGIEAAQTEQGFVDFLRVASKFHTYSLSNQLLILSQNPEATLVKGYRQWQELNRQVTKGSEAIKIFYPQFRLVEEPDPVTGELRKEHRLTGYGIGNVFDIKDTEGDPLPKRPRPIDVEGSSETAAEVNRRLSWWLLEEGLTMSTEELPGLARGTYKPEKKHITIRSTEYVDVDEDTGELTIGRTVDPLNVQMTKTLCHEAAHYVADHKGDGTDRKIKELVAEGSAFVVMDHFGLDTASYTFAYVADWLGEDRDAVTANLRQIKHVSGTLINAIENTTVPMPEPAPDAHLEADYDDRQSDNDDGLT